MRRLKWAALSYVEQGLDTRGVLGGLRLSAMVLVYEYVQTDHLECCVVGMLVITE
jgi:hypothetical protein